MDVSDDVLGLVLERVGSHVSLIRAAAVCRRWRRAIADAAFLRRRLPRRLPIAIFQEGGSEGPVIVPSSTSKVDARHFSLDFLPDGAGFWNILDSRGSLLLMSRRGFELPFLVMAVCEPLTRRCKIIPRPSIFDDGCFFLGFYLVDGYTNKAGGRISMSNFRVKCMLQCDGDTHTAMFTAASDTDLLWSEKTIDRNAPRRKLSCALGHAGGS
uniref:F-box domain-containing protein n=1 Tax=Setaria viridis TaxID=4556 RepID=A0A4U6VKF1_SETVI|nr:hypothetical protein SEVIR_3G384100v2 [Setaria viridis]